MKCPTCITDDLRRAEREGVEIDICNNCGGIWLDRGELDLLLDQTCADSARRDAPRKRERHDRFRRFRRAYDGDFGGPA